MTNNPLINQPKHKYDAVPFDSIKREHFIPALDYAIKDAEKKLDIIINNPDNPTFDNTAIPLENCTELLNRIANTYFNLMGAESDNEFKELAQEISPKLAAFHNKIIMNSKLFQRIKLLYENNNKEKLTSEQKRLIEEKYKDFIHNGALLNAADKEKVKNIDEKLSKLSPKFDQNTLNATNKFSYYTNDETELLGIPEISKLQASEAAQEKNKLSGWLFTLQMPSYIPIMQFADNRSLRERIFKSRAKISFGGEYDNQKNVLKCSKLRYEKARILGFQDHADYILQKRMAGNTENVMNFLDNLYEVYYPAAKEELDEIKKLAKEDGIDEIQSWDLAYYSEKLKKNKFDFDQEKLRPYFKVENVIEGIFKVAELLYDIKFIEINDVPVYHKDVRVFKVNDYDGSFLALFYIDLHPRKTKRGGAWMTSWRQQGLYNNKLERPLISIVANLTPSTKNKPSLLTYDEVETIFHEFGHALHGILSNVTYSSLASPDVYWDFVELPSQIMENWLADKETLKLFAKHYETGVDIPNKLIDKIRNSQSFNAGMRGLRQLTFAYLDMAWHTGNPKEIDNVENFENLSIEKTCLLPKIEGSNISCQFGHIFSGGYSAGYYSYKWAEALDADAFEYFKENGIFNKDIARSFRINILEKGNTESPMNLYIKFRGKKPDSNALLRRDKLINNGE